MKSVVFAALVSVAHAACPNACSGHGECNTFDQCSCYGERSTLADRVNKTDLGPDEWTGADCSLRTCPRGISWVKYSKNSSHWSCKHDNGARDALRESDHPNFYLGVECSDQGLCDRSTGLCTCFDGYEGSACQRTSCPNDCSGHGTCRSNEDFAYDFSNAKTNYMLKGNLDDILPEYQSTYIATYANAWDSGMHYGCLCDAGYRGPDCSLIECPSMDDPLDDKCPEPEEKLKDTVNVQDFQLQYDMASGSSAHRDAYKPGKGYNKFQATPAGATTNVIFACYGADAGQDCSGRGICDYTTGSCSCFTGFSGTACEEVSEMS